MVWATHAVLEPLYFKSRVQTLVLKLNNGKERDLNNFNNIEIEKVKQYLNDIGIK